MVFCPEPDRRTRNLAWRCATAGGGDRNIKYFRLCSGRFGNKLYKKAGGVFALWNGVDFFPLLHVVDAGFRRRSLGPPHERSIAARTRGTMHANLRKMFAGAYCVVGGGHHKGAGRRGRKLRAVDITPWSICDL